MFVFDFVLKGLLELDGKNNLLKENNQEIYIAKHQLSTIILKRKLYIG